MDLVFSIFMLFCVVRWQTDVHGYSLTNATDSVLGCSHNNTKFANGSFVPTVEPCLNCKCINANLICALRVCPEQAFPPPRGCVIVQKKNSCCPYMTCTKLHNVYKDQEKKVITHDRKWYEQNIRNRIFSHNALQRRIEDDPAEEEQQLSNGKMCVFNGTVYRSGSAMTTSSLCTYCYCIEGKQKCIQPKCTLPEKNGCEPISIDSSCCPIRYDCTENKTIKARFNTKYNRRRNGNKHYLRMTSRMQRSRGCLVDSTFYPEGHKLPANQTNPCEICFCIGGSKRCTPKKCAPMIRNCKPIIPNGQCCPSSYDCKTVSDRKTARGFTSRQYSDFFSLLFGDEDKENSTASLDYETETENSNAGSNATFEKGLFDVIKDSLNYVEANKQAAVKQTHDPNQTVQHEPNAHTYNVSSNEDDDDEDDEEISLFDIFLKGESAFTPTTSTSKPLVFNVTGKPLLNGMTNSPMQIQPVLPENMQNESLKFSMLPMSLYNMVKEDGSVAFEDEKIHEIPQVLPSHPPTTSDESIRHTVKEVEIEVTSMKSHVVSVSTTNKNDFEVTTRSTTTKQPVTTTTQAPVDKSVEVVSSVRPQNTSKDHEMDKVIKTEIVTVKNVEKVTQKPVVSTVKPKTTSAPVAKVKPTRHTAKANATKSNQVTTEKVIRTTTMPPKKLATTTRLTTTTTIKSTTESTTVSMQPLTTRSSTEATSAPKITAVQISSNPSILDTDISYDYSEPTLPPSLPNLKIIPFLPADAVKNIIHKNEGYKSNYNYYQTNPNTYSGPEAHIESPAYTPFNVKPSAEKYPTYTNTADDRLDYDTYKTQENTDSLDYINVYATAGNMVQPSSFQLSVNSKLDYGSNQQVVPSKIPPIPNKNLTLKPPLPPFEPEHEYNLYNSPPQHQLQIHPGNTYDEYSVNSPVSSEPYAPEHNYNVPHFVTMPPLKEPPRRPTNNKESVFSYGNLNKFIPPAKTEGGFIPKRTPGDNYIPLHGNNYYPENAENKMTTKKTSVESASNEVEPQQNNENIRTAELNQTVLNFDKHVISITTNGDDYRSTEAYNDAFLGVDILGPYKKQSEEYDLANDDTPDIPNQKPDDNKISFNKLYGLLFADDENASDTISEVVGTSPSPSSTTAISSPPSKNLTNNAIPLKLITILNNSKKENPDKVETPQRKNNKIIDPTDEPLVEDTNVPSVTSEMPPSSSSDSEKNDDLSILRDVFLSSINRPPINSGDLAEDLLHKPPLFLSRPINKLSPSFISTASFPSLNSLDAKHNFQKNPIRSELDLIVTELNKNNQANDFSHTNNFSPENYQVLPADDTNISNTESYVVNPVDVAKLKQHQSEGETKIFTPNKDPAGLLKLAGCNIFGRMYRVGKIIAELSSACLECRCTEVGVSCTPLNC